MCSVRISVLSCVLIILSSFITNKIIDFLSLQPVDLVELSSCPACYGISACDKIFNKNIQIQAFDFYTYLSHLFNKKNVFYGNMNGTKIVMKKLAQEDELRDFDTVMCENLEFLFLCRKNNNKNIFNNDINDSNYNEININKIDFLPKINNEIFQNFTESLLDNTKLLLCPTISHFNKIISEIKLVNDVNYINLWTLIKINPEPIILTILRAEEGWPVARYYGACGRVVVEEYVGAPLAVYYNEPWYRRAKIAINLLDAARVFTFQHRDFSFYLTDLSADNIAIDHNDKPKFIDLENIIILNRNITDKEKSKTWHNVHVSENIIDCEDCFSYSPMDICNHHVSDHNYYAICKEILFSTPSKNSDFTGFLHDIPKNVRNLYPNLILLINECLTPTIVQSRINAGNELMAILQEIITN